MNADDMQIMKGLHEWGGTDDEHQLGHEEESEQGAQSRNSEEEDNRTAGTATTMQADHSEEAERLASLQQVGSITAPSQALSENAPNSDMADNDSSEDNSYWEDIDHNATVAANQALLHRPAVHAPKRGTKRSEPQPSPPGSVRSIGDSAKRQRVRKTAAEKQITKPKLSARVPKNQRLSDEALIEVARKSNSYDRHAAAPYAFNYRGHLYKEYHHLAVAREKDGQLSLSAAEITHLLNHAAAKQRHLDNPDLFNSRGQLRARKQKLYEDSRDGEGHFLSPAFAPEQRKATGMGAMQIAHQAMMGKTTLNPKEGQKQTRVRDERRQVDEAAIGIVQERMSFLAAKEQMRKDVALATAAHQKDMMQLKRDTRVDLESMQRRVDNQLQQIERITAQRNHSQELALQLQEKIEELEVENEKLQLRLNP
ncbi:MAG: actin [Chaenotheca gracillima]|nr:MAG: actin [Chaenotheca gracillima]